MSDHEVCLHEKDWGALWQLVKSHTDHVMEGDRPVTGYRDRLLNVEIEVKSLKDAIKERFWKCSITGGVIGALVGSGAKDAITLLIKWVIGQ